MGNPEPQIGQLLIIGFDGTEMSPRLSSLLTRIQPAGVILFRWLNHALAGSVLRCSIESARMKASATAAPASSTSAPPR